MKKKLVIIGSGDLGQQIAHFATISEKYEIVGFYDDYKEVGISINGFPCLGKIEAMESHYLENLFDEVILGIGYKHLEFKKKIYKMFKEKIPFATIIHPSVIIDKTAKVGAGVVIYPGCIIDQYVSIEDNVVLNVGCCIAHDTIIGAHSFLSPRVAIAGFVKIGNMNILGINSSIIDNITTVDKVQLGGGAVVVKSIEESGLYVGNPVRFIR